MREIKFRAWNGEMTYINDWYWFEESGVRDVEKGIAYGNHAIYNLMQFTGLTDKNGRNIYEGDIVFTENYGKYPMEIKWDEKTASFYCHDKSGDEDDHLNMLAVTEVVGNIYEGADADE